MSIQSFSSSSPSSSSFLHIIAKGRELWGSAPLRILSFIHSLNNDSDDDGCPFQSFALFVSVSLSLPTSLFLFLSSMRAKHMHTLHTQIRTKETSYGLENEKQRSRRRSCSYQFTASRLDARKKLSV